MLWDTVHSPSRCRIIVCMAAARIGQFDDLLQLASEPLRPVVSRLRSIILDIHSNACEVVRLGDRAATYGCGPGKMIDGYAYIMPFKSWVNLGFFRGTSLADPCNLLEGTGCQDAPREDAVARRHGAHRCQRVDRSRPSRAENRSRPVGVAAGRDRSNWNSASCVGADTFLASLRATLERRSIKVSRLNQGSDRLFDVPTNGWPPRSAGKGGLWSSIRFGASIMSFPPALKRDAMPTWLVP